MMYNDRVKTDKFIHKSYTVARKINFDGHLKTTFFLHIVLHLCVFTHCVYRITGYFCISHMPLGNYGTLLPINTFCFR